jgi:hypothetical protein
MIDDDIDQEAIRILELVADRVAEKLGQSVIPSSFPAEIGDWIREASKYGARLYRQTIPMNGPTAIFTEWRVNPDGTLNLQLQDTNGSPFWNGTFRPVMPDGHAAGA